MRRSTLLAAVLLAAFAAPAFAADEAPKPADDQSIKLSPVGLPIIVDGRVVNYVFVTVVIDLTPSADQISLREKEPDFRDILVREAHRSPFVILNDYNHLDEAKLKAVLYRDAVAIAGPHTIKAVEVQSQQAQHFIHAPKPNPPVSN